MNEELYTCILTKTQCQLIENSLRYTVQTIPSFTQQTVDEIQNIIRKVGFDE